MGEKNNKVAYQLLCSSSVDTFIFIFYVAYWCSKAAINLQSKGIWEVLEVITVIFLELKLSLFNFMK